MFIEFIERVLTILKIKDLDLSSKIIDEWPYEIGIAIYKDVKPLLKDIKYRGFKVIIISNVSSEKNLSIYLSRLNIKRFFDRLIASGTVGYEKPDPGIFQLALNIMNISPADVIHVGDDYEADYIGASSIGLYSILIDRNDKYLNLDIRGIKKLTELTKYLELSI